MAATARPEAARWTTAPGTVPKRNRLACESARLFQPRQQLGRAATRADRLLTVAVENGDLCRVILPPAIELRQFLVVPAGDAQPFGASLCFRRIDQRI